MHFQLRHLFVLCLGLLFTFNSFAQKNDIIQWSPDYKLVWDDFKGKPDKKSPYKASTFSGFSVESMMDGEDLKMIVLCQFTKSKSWVKKDSKVDPLLLHEQGHFDITEWFARKLRKEYSKQKFDPYSKKTNKIIDDLFQSVYKECRQTQKEYDHDTKHGIAEKEQARWTAKIAKEIAKLDQY